MRGSPVKEEIVGVQLVSIQIFRSKVAVSHNGIGHVIRISLLFALIFLNQGKMVQLNLYATATILLALATASLGQTVANNGGRKVGIVIDESNSMQDNDPSNLRIDAGNKINGGLIDKTEATGGKVADEVTVVGFHDSPDLLYNLGDPSGATPVIDGITSNKSGTFIGGGIGSATDELTKPGTGTTANRTGIVVLTDGEDNFSGLTGVQGTINEIARAGKLGIRVSFGFLSVLASSQDSRILSEIIKTGGTFSSFTSPESQDNFVEQVQKNGITGMDATSTSTTLLPGLNTSAILSQTGNTFSYIAKAGEAFNFTITTLDFVALNATLRDILSDTILASNTTSRTGVAVIQHTAAVDVSLELLVKAAGGSTGLTGSSNDDDVIFQVGVQSSLGLDGGKGSPTAAATPSPTKNAGAGIQPMDFSGTTFSLLGVLFSAFLWV